MNTLCMTTNLSSSDIAAWAQFGAAVLGALTTVGVAYWASQAQRYQSLRALGMMSAQLEFVLNEVQAACKANDEGKLRRDFGMLKEVETAIRGIPMHTLPLHHMRNYVEQLKICRTAVDKLEEWELNGIESLSDTIRVLAPTFETLYMQARTITNRG
ncbi:hypothetical protein [Methylibium sp. Root1272]|uniref:hypothetical protein n=1 Tax=Methylibium sp. Root1272 TaxID=1736441 RepID=UPI000714437F|nr:hypothetical protein [Methylibium sp. Root1272]KQW76597.1 hypothetical protein ASC67_02795 [Methylibium sp. Root1272]